jgi:hypothetical protein
MTVTKPISRRIVDQATGMLTHDWWQKLSGLFDAASSSSGVTPHAPTHAAGGSDAVSISASQVSDATAAGRSMLTAANAGAQTALLSNVAGDAGSGGTKGLAPAPAAGDTATNKYLSAAGIWAKPNVTFDTDGTFPTPPGGGTGGTPPGGTSGQIQWNNTGSFAGFTVSGDATLNTSTGALTITKINGVSISTAGANMATAASVAAQTALLSPVVGDSGSGGTKGLVPAPAAGDAAAGKFLKADGTWAAGSGGVSILGTPTAGQIPIWLTSTVVAGYTVSGDGTLGATGVLSITKTGGTAFAPSATTDTTIASNISSGTLPAAQLPNPSASTLGGVQSKAAVSHQFLTSISTSGVPASAQPSASDVSGLAASATTDATNASNIASGTLPAARLPNPSASTLGGIQSKAAVSHQFLTSISTSGVPASAQPAAGDITGLAASATTDTTIASNISSGTLPAAQLPNPSASTLGGVQSKTATTHQFLTSISTSGVPASAQPAAGDISGLAASATTDTTDAANISSGTLAAARLPATPTSDNATDWGSGSVRWRCVYAASYRLNSNVGIFIGSGSPAGSLTAGVGSLYIRADGNSTSTRLYVNTNGSTGWTNFVSAA